MIKRKLDADIQRDVLAELRWDSRVDEADIGVSVKDGVVTLGGTVGSYAERLAAKDAAHRVAGVLDVANDILVKLPGSRVRTDGEIASAIRQALEWDVLVPHQKIQSTVSNGWVTLEGSVASWQEREDAERSTRHLTGVKGVTNLIRVQPVATDPTITRGAIEEALERRAEREARRIRVEVDDGTVT